MDPGSEDGSIRETIVVGIESTAPAREQTAIVGSSLGGLVSAYAGVHHADVLGLVNEIHFLLAPRPQL